MTLANKLTLLRIILIPAILAVLYAGFPGNTYWALGLFIVASITDLLDGFIARRYHQVTNLGKFLDPLADKMLVLSTMCYFVENQRMWGWVLALVLFREFAVSGLRMIAVERGRVIAAAWSGKVKTAVTMVLLCVQMAFHLPWLDMACQGIIAFLTVYSGIEYFVKNLDVFRENTNES